MSAVPPGYSPSPRSDRWVVELWFTDAPAPVAAVYLLRSGGSSFEAEIFGRAGTLRGSTLEEVRRKLEAEFGPNRRPT